jgi:hypothetical protein
MISSNPTLSNPRADGFSLYMNYVGDNILKNIFPKAKMLKSTIHKLMPKTKMLASDLAQENNAYGFSKNKYQ